MQASTESMYPTHTSQLRSAQFDAPKRSGDVQSAVAHQQSEIDQLEKAVSDLCGRLRSILCDSPRPTDSVGNEAKHAAQQSCELSRMLHEHAFRIQGIVESLRSLTDSVEL